jgi:hypothetical protein
MFMNYVQFPLISHSIVKSMHIALKVHIIQIVSNFVQSVPSDESYGSCYSRKWILGCVVLCETVCEIHVAQLLQTLS